MPCWSDTIPRRERQEARRSESGNTELLDQIKGKSRSIPAKALPEVYFIVTLPRQNSTASHFPKISLKCLQREVTHPSTKRKKNSLGNRSASLPLTMITLGQYVLCTAPNYPSL